MAKPKRRAVAAIILAFLASLGDATAVETSRQHGEEILAFDPRTITELSVQAVGLRLVAHRWNLAKPFYIAVFTQTGVGTCQAGGGLTQVLRSMQSLRVLRTLSPAETHQLQNGSARVIHLRLMATTDIDLGEWIFYVPAQKAGGVAVQSEHMEQAAEVAMGTDPFSLITQGCRALGKPRSAR